MAEPASTAADVLVAKYGIVIGSFVGVILSLGFLKDLTRGQAGFVVLTGFFFSIFLTLPVSSWLAPRLDLPLDDYFLCGVSFVLGLTAMNIIPAIKAAMGAFVAARGV
jgi:hypothetical protein